MSCWRAFLHEVFLELRDIPVFAKLGILHLQTFLNFSHSFCLCRSCLEVGSQIETPPKGEDDFNSLELRCRQRLRYESHCTLIPATHVTHLLCQKPLVLPLCSSDAFDPSPWPGWRAEETYDWNTVELHFYWMPQKSLDSVLESQHLASPGPLWINLIFSNSYINAIFWLPLLPLWLTFL